MRRGVAVAAFAFAAVLAAAAQARAVAATELCPAAIGALAPVSAAPSQYAYTLTAATPRTVDAGFIADTDRGWFAWSAAGVPLMAVEHNARADSAAYAVTFPQPVVVRHAWVTSASANGKVRKTCELPAFGAPGNATPQPIPAPAGPPAIAIATSEPFVPLTCPQPFAPARLLSQAPAEPIPHGFGSAQIAGVSVYVLVGATGTVLDAWVATNSGDLRQAGAALDAARRSQYAPAVSYCRPVAATYVLYQVL